MGCLALLQGLNPHLLGVALTGGFFSTSATWEVHQVGWILSHPSTTSTDAGATPGESD